MYRSTLQTQYASWRLHATTVLLSSGDILLCTVCTVLWGWGSYHDKNNITFSFVSYNLRLFGWYNLVILQTLIYPAWIEHFRNLFSHLISSFFLSFFFFFFFLGGIMMLPQFWLCPSHTPPPTAVNKRPSRHRNTNVNTNLQVLRGRHVPLPLWEIMGTLVALPGESWTWKHYRAVWQIPDRQRYAANNILVKELGWPYRRWYKAQYSLVQVLLSRGCCLSQWLILAASSRGRASTFNSNW